MALLMLCGHGPEGSRASGRALAQLEATKPGVRPLPCRSRAALNIESEPGKLGSNAARQVDQRRTLKIMSFSTNGLVLGPLM